MKNNMILALSWRDIKSPKAGGAEIHSHEFYKCVSECGYEIVSITPLYDGLEKEAIIDGIRYLRYGNIATVIFYAMGFYRRHKNEIQFVIDQCNTHRFFSKFWVPQNKRIFYIHQLTREIWDINAVFPFSKIGKISENPLLKLNRRDCTITVSNSTKHELVELGFDPRKIFIVPNGISEEIIKKNGREEKCLRPTFIYVGRYAKYKGIDVAVEAIGRLKNEGIDSCLWVVGKRDEVYIEKKLIPICEKYNLSYSNEIDGNEDIIFTGFVSGDDKFRLQSKAIALLFPSIREGWGIIVSEAACVGTPSIVFNSPGARDAVDYGNAGYMCDENTVDGLKRCMMKALTDKGDYEIKRKKAFDYTTRFTWDNNKLIVKDIMCEIESIYQEK